MYKSKIWDIPLEDFKKDILNSISWNSLVKKYFNHSGNVRTIKSRVNKENIDFSHFTGKMWSKGKTIASSKIYTKHKIDEILIENSTYSGSGQVLKKRLIREKDFIDKCAICKLSSLWNNKPIVLQLDHINGSHTDNRIENLRIICPNCHSQTPTFCGKTKNCDKFDIQKIEKGALVECECGSIVTKRHLAKHKKTNKHKKLMDKQTILIYNQEEQEDDKEEEEEEEEEEKQEEDDKEEEEEEQEEEEEDVKRQCRKCNKKKQITMFKRHGPNGHSLSCLECDKHVARKLDICMDCNMILDDVNVKKCVDCTNKNIKYKERPSYERLNDDLVKMSYVACGIKYGVSDNAIRKWLRTYEGNPVRKPVFKV